MKLNSYTAFLLAALLLSTGISYIGYRYLGLANAYREANFLHLNAVDLAIDLLNQDQAPDTLCTRAAVDGLCGDRRGPGALVHRDAWPD